MSISLTAGMRANLFNLQSTSKLMEQTQVRLNTGKKVNSALDDPTSYFTARSHMSRATDLDSLKNGMSEAIQTITAANSGIESMITMLESAKATAQSGKAASTGSANVTQTITLSGVAADDQITIGGLTYSATANGTTGHTADFEVGASNEITAMNLATLINSNEETDNQVVATAVNGASITLEISGSDMVNTSVQNMAASFTESGLIAGNDELGNLAAQYTTLMSQIDDLSNDSGYKGINLLAAENLTVDFEGTNELTVTGFNADVESSVLNLTKTRDASSTHWGTSSTIDADIAAISTAIDALESKQSSLASSLNIVKTRQDFTSNIVNTLETGADNLTLADMNEEGANMLMLQTQQALGVNALSLSSQAAQSVLRLF